MHILIVTHYYEPDTGAAAVRLSLLAKKLQARGHEITVLTTLPHYPVGKIKEGYRGKFFNVEDHEGIRVIRTWLWATPSPKISRQLLSQITFMFTAFLRGIGLKRPDIALIEGQPFFTALAGQFICNVKNTPYVLNVSNLWPENLVSVGTLTEKNPIYRIARYIVDSNYRAAAGIIALSPVWAKKIVGYIGQEDKTSVIYNGVALQHFRPDIDPTAFRQQHNLGDKKLVSFIGTFAAQYDFDAMMQVAVAFQNREDVVFAFIGTGEQSRTVKKQAKSMHNIQLIDWLDYETIPQAWAVSHLTYWAMHDKPHYKGLIPAKLYEALACGVPVAATIAGEGAAMLKASNGGISLYPGDNEGLITAITTLLDDSAVHEKHSKAGRAYAEAHFNPDTVAWHYETQLLNALRKRP